MIPTFGESAPVFGSELALSALNGAIIEGAPESGLAATLFGSGYEDFEDDSMDEDDDFDDLDDDFDDDDDFEDDDDFDDDDDLDDDLDEEGEFDEDEIEFEGLD
jgi:hypothetical protein